MRLALDRWMGSAHWPTGLLYRLAHVALNLLFAFLTVTYLALAAWHLGGLA